jgi:hypothetical protein
MQWDHTVLYMVVYQFHCSQMSYLLMFVYILFFVILCQCARDIHSITAVANYKSHVKVKWLFLHYHKTGAFVSEAISKSVSVDKFMFKEGKSKRLDFSPTNTANVVLSHAGNVLFNWTTTLITSKFQYRKIHFVRDPHDMIISGMLYHSQRPPPERKLLHARLHILINCNDCGYFS